MGTVRPNPSPTAPERCLGRVSMVVFTSRSDPCSPTTSSVASRWSRASCGSTRSRADAGGDPRRRPRNRAPSIGFGDGGVKHGRREGCRDVLGVRGPMTTRMRDLYACPRLGYPWVHAPAVTRLCVQKLSDPPDVGVLDGVSPMDAARKQVGSPNRGTSQESIA